MRYGREIKYESSVHADYAPWGARSHVSRWRQWPLLAGAAFLLALTVDLLLDSPIESSHPPDTDAPRERIGIRIPGKALDHARDQLLARLPFEPRVPLASTAAPRMLPETALQHEDWQTTQIRPGDNLSLIFNRIGVDGRDAQRVLKSAKSGGVLRTIIAGQTLAYRLVNGELQALAYEIDRFKTVLLKKNADSFDSEVVELESDIRLASASGEITRSLFLDGQAAGLSDRIIMEFTEIFGWDVDFVLDMRRGDKFKVIYEEIYRAGEKVSNGRILGAEFTNRGKTHRAIFFKDADGGEGYYSDNGEAMRKAFLRAPLNFSRISSRFNLARRHPILNRLRAHRGVDYAAPMGTPIRAVADGKIEFAGSQNGYGNVIILKHGDSYSTLYGHLSKFAKQVSRGKSISQGQLIGYVGKSGLATGPHLHYEFRINGVHHDPLTVKLPRSLSVEPGFVAEFRKQTKQTLAMLNSMKEGEGDTSSGMVANAGRDRLSGAQRDM